MDKYKMVNPGTEGLPKRVVVLDHLIDLDSSIKLTEEQIEKIHETLEELRGGLPEGKP